MADKIKELLKMCHEKWPTEVECHCITYDVEKDKLLLNIFYNDKWYTFNPEDNELDDFSEAIRTMSKWLS